MNTFERFVLLGVPSLEDGVLTGSFPISPFPQPSMTHLSEQVALSLVSEFWFAVLFVHPRIPEY